MYGRQGFTVHFVRKKRVGTQGFLDRNGTAKQGITLLNNVEALERNVPDTFTDLRSLEYVAQSGSGPHCVANGLRLPSKLSMNRRYFEKLTSPITSTLQARDDSDLKEAVF